MKVLVTGGTGFVGSPLCEELARRGHDVTALARDPSEADFDGDVETVRGDVTDYYSIEPHFEGVDCVVQLVALSPLFRPDGGNEMHFEVHLEGTKNAVQAAEEHGVGLFLQVSGIHADPNADTAYLRAKGQAEEVVRGSGLDWIVFRPTVFFGDGDEFRSFTKLVATPYLTPLPGGGKQEFQVMWIGDGAAIMADAIEGRTDGRSPAESESDTDAEAVDEPADVTANPHVGETYEIGGPRVQPFAELVRLIYAAENKPVSVVPVPMRLADVGLSVLGAVGGPLGADQATSLRKDLTVSHNDIDAFGWSTEDLTAFEAFIGIDAARLARS